MASTSRKTTKPAGNSVPTLNEEQRFARLEQLVNNWWTCRQEFFKQFNSQHKDIENECGWPDALNAELYRSLYDRNPIAERVVEVYPKECWQMSPTVYEDESAENATEFEEAWDALGSNLMINGESWLQDEEGSLVWSYLLRADIMSGIGTYGILLLGLDDGKLLEEPVDGAPPDGAPIDVTGVSDLTSKDIYGGQLPKALEQPLASTMGTDAQYFGVQFTPMQPQRKDSQQRRLLFLRVFDEHLVQVVQYEASMYSPRFGMPIMYRVTLNDPRQPHTGIGLPLATVRVHWSRVIHIADNLQSSEIFGAPRMRAVLNTILDLRKLYGGSAEMYWRGAFPGLSIETHPEMGGDAILDIGGLRQMMEDYHSGLQRWISLLGMTAKSLAPQVVDPSPQIRVQLEAICIKLGVPLRVFMGSERGELASSQDDAAWNDRLRARQKFHITPRIIAPFIDRLILLRVLPEPSGYSIEWPDLDSTTKKDKAAIALQTTQAIAAYVAGGVEGVVPPRDYLTRILGWDEEEAEAVLETAEEAQQDKQEEAEALADKHGFEPAPPPGFSKPKPPPPVLGSAQGNPSSKAEHASETSREKELEKPTPAANLSYARDTRGGAEEAEATSQGRGEAKRYSKKLKQTRETYRPPHVATVDAQRKPEDGEVPAGAEEVVDPPRPKVVRNYQFWGALLRSLRG
jgi:hypothetical protein